MRANVALLVVAVFACRSAWATSLIPPRSFGELAMLSDAVVLARAVASECRSRFAGRQNVPPGAAPADDASGGAGGMSDIPYTLTEFRVVEDLSGFPERGDTLYVRTPGGNAGGRTWKVAAVPAFEPGATYLLCLQHRSGPRDDSAGFSRDADRAAEDVAAAVWLTAMLSYGVLRETAAPNGDRLLVPMASATEANVLPRPDGDPVEAIVPFHAELLLSHLREVLSGASAWNAAEVRVVDAGSADSTLSAAGGIGAVPQGCFYFNEQGFNWRRAVFDSHGSISIFANVPGEPGLPEGGFRQVQEAMDLWMDVPNVSCNLLFAGAREIEAGCGGDPNFVMFADPCDEIADLLGCSGVLAFGGGTTNGSHLFDGELWMSMATWFVVLNNDVGCLGTVDFRLLLAHELGHGLGFDHSVDSTAMMWSTCCNNMSFTDVTCARYTYPSRSDNIRPQVNAGEDRTLSLSGNTTKISGTVVDDGLPAGDALVTSWRHVYGPGIATFSDETALQTAVSFPASGVYILGLVAHDGELLRMDQVRIEVEIFAADQETRVFQTGRNFYFGSADTMILESDPGADHAFTSELTVDADEPSGSGQLAEVLLRFDHIFGTRKGQVFPGMEIRSARLEITSTNSGDGAFLHRMKEAWNHDEGWQQFGARGVLPGIHAETFPDVMVDGSDGGTLSIDVTESVAIWSANPCTNHGWVLIPAGDDGWDFYSAEGKEPPRLVIEPSTYRRERIIAVGEEWRYFKGTTRPNDDWRETSFVPGSDWMAGPSGIGYGDGDDTTELEDMRGSYVSIYARHEFDLSREFDWLILRIDYDDGFIGYLNGIEVARSASMSRTGASVTWDTPAGALREAGLIEEYALDVALLRPGKNVLAVQIHNANLDSSDLSFRPELVGGFRVDPHGRGCGVFQRADVNNDGSPGFSDAIYLLNHLFGDGPAPVCSVAADMNGDLTVNIADPIALLQHLFAGGPALPAPFPECGQDPRREQCPASVCN